MISLNGTPKYLTCLADVSPSARFTVFPENDAVQAWDWPMNGVVYMTIDDPATLSTSPDYGQFATVGPAPWDENQILAYFNFSGVYDVKPGDLVTLIYGPTVVSYEVEPISLTDVDPVADTIGGTALPGETVFVWQHGQDWARQEPEAAADGGWVADFKLADPPFDIAPGASGRAEVSDDRGNSTAVDWSVPIPGLRAFPDADRVDGDGWPAGQMVTLTVDGRTFETTANINGHVELALTGFRPEARRRIDHFERGHRRRPYGQATLRNRSQSRVSGDSRNRGRTGSSARLF